MQVHPGMYHRMVNETCVDIIGEFLYQHHDTVRFYPPSLSAMRNSTWDFSVLGERLKKKYEEKVLQADKKSGTWIKIFTLKPGRLLLSIFVIEKNTVFVALLLHTPDYVTCPSLSPRISPLAKMHDKYSFHYRSNLFSNNNSSTLVRLCIQLSGLKRSYINHRSSSLTLSE